MARYAKGQGDPKLAQKEVVKGRGRSRGLIKMGPTALSHRTF